MLQNGTFDFECGSTTNNLERQQQAAFSDTIFVIGTRLLVKKGSDIKDFADLKGKTVVVTSGTTSEVLLNKLNEEKKLDLRIISAKDHGDSFRTLETGRLLRHVEVPVAATCEAQKRITGISSHPASKKPMLHYAYDDA